MDNKEEMCLLKKMSDHNEALRACIVRMDAVLSRLQGVKPVDPERCNSEAVLGVASQLTNDAERLHIELARQIDELNTLL